MTEEIELKDIKESSPESILPLIFRRIKSMPRKTRYKLFVKSVIVVLCVAGLIAFSTILFHQFTSGNTVVNIKYEILYYNKIPGITICFLHGLSLEKMKLKYPKLLKELEQDFNRTVQNGTDDKKQDNDTFLAVKYVHSILWKFLSNSDYTIKELFDMSIPFSEIGASQFTVSGICRNPNDTFEECKNQDSDPIESMAFYDTRYIKCFTFFSHLNPR